MKPRILILMHYLELGGAETSLIGLLEALDPNRVEVDLFIHSHQGPLMQYIPCWVNLLPEVKAYSVIERPIKEAIKRGQFGVAWGRLKAKIKHRRHHKRLSTELRTMDSSEFQYIADSVEPYLPLINPDVEYDLCISYLTPHNYALSKVRAKRLLAWIHTDYSTIRVNTEQELPVWSQFDYIASISPDVTTAFLSTFPTLKTKIIEQENIMPIALIRSRAEEFVPDFNRKDINLLSIGRYSSAKNFDNVPDIASRIVAKGVSNLRWYIIGYGEEQPIRRAIEEASMQEHVILLGKKENPYPYIKACDIYIQPSRYEGKSITVREAQILGKPVVITNYPTAHSQINHGIDGYIVPLDNEGCADALENFILNKQIKLEIISNLKSNVLKAQQDIEKIYSLIQK